jgi:hypothetical protein
MTIEAIKSCNNLDKPWPAALLLNAIGFISRVRGRVEDYLGRRNVPTLRAEETGILRKDIFK